MIALWGFKLLVEFEELAHETVDFLAVGWLDRLKPVMVDDSHRHFIPFGPTFPADIAKYTFTKLARHGLLRQLLTHFATARAR